jgi:hypothetical protein
MCLLLDFLVHVIVFYSVNKKQANFLETNKKIHIIANILAYFVENKAKT